MARTKYLMGEKMSTEFLTWLNMGGYAKYVWPSYILCWISFTSLLFSAYRHHKAIKKQIHDQITQK